MSEALPTRIHALARRVDRNVPRRHDPEAFHAEKSEIAADLRRLAREVTPVRESDIRAGLAGTFRRIVTTRHGMAYETVQVPATHIPDHSHARRLEPKEPA